MEDLKLADLNLSLKESRGIIKFLVRKRNIKNYKRKSINELLQAIKENVDNQEQSKNKERIDTYKRRIERFKL